MTIASKLTTFFIERGCDAPEITILQPADPFLETAGEDLRRRVFITENEVGDALCLRPEFTIPAVFVSNRVLYIANHAVLASDHCG